MSSKDNNNNILSVVPQSGVWENRVYRDLILPSEVERLFPLDTHSRKNSPKHSRNAKRRNQSQRNPHFTKGQD